MISDVPPKVLSSETEGLRGIPQSPLPCSHDVSRAVPALGIRTGSSPVRPAIGARLQPGRPAQAPAPSCLTLRRPRCAEINESRIHTWRRSNAEGNRAFRCVRIFAERLDSACPLRPISRKPIAASLLAGRATTRSTATLSFSSTAIPLASPPSSAIQLSNSLSWADRKISNIFG